MGDAGTASPDAVCPRCDRLNREAATYCGGCGLELPGERPCPACGAPNPRRHQYCDMCGGAMLAHDSSPLPARPASARPADTPRRARPRGLFTSLPGAWPYAAVLAAAAVLPRLYRLDSPLTAGLGVVAVGLFFLLVRHLLGPRPALLASIILALSFWHIQISRLALPTMLMLTAGLVVANLLAAAFDETRSDARRRALGIAAAIAALPYLLIAASDPGAVVEQVTAYSITASQEYQDIRGIPEQTRYLAGSVAKTVVRVFFGALGGEQTRLLDAITGLLALVGLLVCAARWRERGHALLLAFFGAGVVLAGLTTGDELYGRLFVAMTAALAAAGFGLHWTTTWMRGRFSDRVVYGFAVVIIVLVAYFNLDSYFGGAAIR